MASSTTAPVPAPAPVDAAVTTVVVAPRCTIRTPDVMSWSNGVAVTADGCRLLVADTKGRSHSVTAFAIVDCDGDGAAARVRIGGPSRGARALQFNEPRQLCVALDGAVFVADECNDRVQCLTPALAYDRMFGKGRLRRPNGVVANGSVVVVSQSTASRVTVFDRESATVVRSFGNFGGSPGQLDEPCAMCFMPGDDAVAVTELGNRRVSIFRLDGSFVRAMGAAGGRGAGGGGGGGGAAAAVGGAGSGGVVAGGGGGGGVGAATATGVAPLVEPIGVAALSCTIGSAVRTLLLVADAGLVGLQLFRGDGVRLPVAVGTHPFVGVTVHADRVYAQARDCFCCVFAVEDIVAACTRSLVGATV